MQHKHLEFAFLDNQTGNKYQINQEMIQRFHDDDQITKWQEKAFPKNQPSENPRQKDGYLRDGEPVFFLLNEDGETIKFFGRAQMFRLPYELSPLHFIPKNLKCPYVIDIAEAIFGWVRQENKEEKLPEELKQRAGRIFISDAICEKSANDDIWFTENQDQSLTPQILASPKPTTFQHYLVQTDVDKKNLKHYASKPNEETVIRGHKLYWHKGNIERSSFEETDQDKIKKSKSQYTEIKPIKTGVTFTFNIHFENLTDVELGALLWVLDKAKGKYRLKLGMGKPLGLGAVKIESELYLSDRTKRYTHLFNNNNWEVAENLEKNSRCPEYFENYILEKLGQTSKFEDITRIKMLLAMLKWDENPSQKYLSQRRYMEIERNQQPRIGDDSNGYKHRPILPTPLDVMGIEITRDNSNSPTPVPNHPKPKLASRFSKGQIVDAMVIEIQEKQIKKKNKPQLRTIISYQIEGSDCKSREEVNKQKLSLKKGDVVKVKIVKLKENNIRKVQYLGV